MESQRVRHDWATELKVKQKWKKSWNLTYRKQLIIKNSISNWLLLFSCPVMSNTLWPHGLQHARPPCHHHHLKVWLIASLSYTSPVNHDKAVIHERDQIDYTTIHFVVVHSRSCVQLFATPWTAVPQAYLSFTISQSLLILIPIESVMLSNHVIYWCPLLLLLQSSPTSGCFPMSQRFISGGQSIGASASVLLMNIQGWFPLGLTGLISLQFKGLKSLFQHHNSKASILQCSAFFIVQLSHPYMATGKTIALTLHNFFGKVVCLLFNMLPRFVTAFLPRNKQLLVSWL